MHLVLSESPGWLGSSSLSGLFFSVAGDMCGVSTSSSSIISSNRCRDVTPNGRLPRFTGVLGGSLLSKYSGESIGPKETLFLVRLPMQSRSSARILSLGATAAPGDGVGSADSGIDMSDVESEDLQPVEDLRLRCGIGVGTLSNDCYG